MEVIERQISTENFKSRQHSFIPFVGIEYNEMGMPVFPDHGNWGEYPYDIDVCRCSGFENLKVYFGYTEDDKAARISFNDIVKKYRVLRRVMNNAVYYQKITKNGEELKIPYIPDWSEKHKIPVYPAGGDYDDNLYGLYGDSTFEENGGVMMLEFILKAFGIFIVDSKYLGDNYVPEMMYYTEVPAYIEMLREMKRGEDCCAVNDYEMYGGDSFLTYLGGKKLGISEEIDYWKKSLYLTNGEPVSPEMVLSLSLNADFHNIGIYTVTDVISDKEEKDRYIIKHTITEPSKLKYLRHSKVSYCERTVDGITFDEELPVVLLENEDGESLTMTNPYMIGYPKNTSTEIIDDEVVIYGDMIFDIQTGETTDIIKYVIGGRLHYDDTTKIWSFDEDGFERGEMIEGVVYVEEIPFRMYDYSNDPERRYIMLKNGVEVNAFNDKTLISGSKEVKIYDIPDDGIATISFYTNTSKNSDNEDKIIPYTGNTEDISNNIIIMEDYNFGRSETLIENVDDVVIDRGFISAFELHYKMGEVNTMSDIENYSNNIFGL